MKKGPEALLVEKADAVVEAALTKFVELAPDVQGVFLPAGREDNPLGVTEKRWLEEVEHFRCVVAARLRWPVYLELSKKYEEEEDE